MSSGAVGGWRRVRPPDDETTAEDVAYFRALVACLEAGGEDLWDLPCARLALAAIERRFEEIRAARAGDEALTCGPVNTRPARIKQLPSHRRAGLIDQERCPVARTPLPGR